MSTAIITSDTSTNHKTGLGHPEQPDRVTAIIKKVTNISTKFNCRGGTSDSRFLGSIPRLELGLRNNTIHMVDERTSVLDMKKLTKIYYNILENYF